MHEPLSDAAINAIARRVLGEPGSGHTPVQSYEEVIRVALVDMYSREGPAVDLEVRRVIEWIRDGRMDPPPVRLPSP